MTRNKLIAVTTVTVLLLGAAGLIFWNRQRDQAHQHSAAESIYYCPMHPSITSDKPGSCPICGMKLVKRTGSQAADVAAQLAQEGPKDDSLATVSLSPTQRVMANVRTMKLIPTTIASELITTGRVTFDERRLAQVTSYTAGRIEQLFVNFTGDTVVRGRPVAAIYSPDLFATQQEYLLALRNRERMQRSEFAQARGAADELVDSTRRRLMLFGMTTSQVERLEAEGRAFYITTIVSPVSGIVTRKEVVPQQYVEQGQALFEIADLSVVWIEADVYEKDLASIQLGQQVSISSPGFPGVDLPAAVSFIQPVLAGESRSGRVRIELPNRGLRLKPDMYVTVKFFAVSGTTILSVPRTAVVDRGLEQFVWVEVSPGSYVPRKVRTGRRTGDRIEIVAGLEPGAMIVVEGGFLLDSEAQLRSAATQG